jgi:chaperonin cofactor prefoldin
MQDYWLYLFAFLTIASIVALATVGLRLKKSSVRVKRALDPLAQKAKTLKIEVSALKRSRSDRQRRLEGTSSKRK